MFVMRFMRDVCPVSCRDTECGFPEKKQKSVSPTSKTPNDQKLDLETSSANFNSKNKPSSRVQTQM